MTESNQQIKNIVEAALFAADKPLSIDNIIALFSIEEIPSRKVVQEILATLEEDWKDRGLELNEVSSGFRFQVRSTYSVWISRLWSEKPPKYSRALLETLALVLYRQPVTRAEIEDVRGVAVSSSIVKTLLEREWIRIVGHRDVPGKPALYGTTKQFLDYFNLKGLGDLPPLSEISQLDNNQTELQLDDNLGNEPESVSRGSDEKSSDSEILSDEKLAIVGSVDTHQNIGKDSEAKNSGLEDHDNIYTQVSSDSRSNISLNNN